jgi:hypothetical protein
VFWKNVQHYLRFCLSPQLYPNGGISNQGNKRASGGKSDE